MSGWDSAPAAGSGWDDGAAAAAPVNQDVWSAAPAASTGFENSAGDAFGGISVEHISKHENGIDDDACRNCHQSGHYASDCPQPRQMSGECFNCGQVGHNKADCTNEAIDRPFTGTCRNCGEEGHRGSDCPLQTCRGCGQEGHRRADCPTEICKKCGNVGHLAAACEEKYNVYPSDLPEVEHPDDAWNNLIAADKSGDVEDFKTAFWVYVKMVPELTFQELEAGFREIGMKTFIIAKEQNPPSDVYTNVDLQGVADRKYIVSFQHVQKPRRMINADAWPKTPEENMERLKDAGFALDRMIPKCTNCNEMGHIKKNCPQDAEEIERPKVTCSNCNNEGHYKRDCPEPRAVRGGGECRNCGQEGHRASECTEPSNKPVFACRNCNQEGHKAADCTNERVEICRNCDKEGHVSRECPEPKDWMKVKCRLCEQFGHGAARCPNPPKEEEEESFATPMSDANEGAYAVSGGDAGGADWNATAGDDDAWASAPAATISAW